MWLGPAPERRFNPNRFGVYPNAYSYFRWFWDYAGGQMTDSGVHMLDIVQMAFDEAMPKAITALGGKFWFKDNRETPDTMQVTYEYPGIRRLLGAPLQQHRRHHRAADGADLLRDRGTLYVDRQPLQGDSRKGLGPRRRAR